MLDDAALDYLTPRIVGMQPPKTLSTMATALCDSTFPLDNGAKPCAQLLRAFEPTAARVLYWVYREHAVGTRLFIVGALLGLIFGFMAAAVPAIVIGWSRLP